MYGVRPTVEEVLKISVMTAVIWLGQWTVSTAAGSSS